ncbi:hypothetical protein ACSFA0_22840 [Variovorax sp. LT1P1]|uniref:hypothetical protein n=1 Tax=Variovorax sp. LT1P1 TaxID=3443730 RepID=UPI003F44E8D0
MKMKLNHTAGKPGAGRRSRAGARALRFAIALLIASASATTFAKSNACKFDGILLQGIAWEDEDGSARFVGVDGKNLPASVTSRRLHKPPAGMKVNLVAQLAERYFSIDVVEVMVFPVGDETMVGFAVYQVVDGQRHLHSLFPPIKAVCVAI